MKFNSKSHKRRFEREAKKINNRSNTNLALLFLLTADGKLWHIAKHHINKDSINIEHIKLKDNCEQTSYTLLAIAKDIALGTNYLPLRDLADSSIITPKLFNITLTAMTINRNGVNSK